MHASKMEPTIHGSPELATMKISPSSTVYVTPSGPIMQKYVLIDTPLSQHILSAPPWTVSSQKSTPTSPTLLTAPRTAPDATGVERSVKISNETGLKNMATPFTDE